jgi:hypothetical protein
MADASPLERYFRIVRNGDSVPTEINWSKGIENIQKGISEALNARNVAFLLGAGCSSLRLEGKERGIQTMLGFAFRSRQSMDFN